MMDFVFRWNFKKLTRNRQNVLPNVYDLEILRDLAIFNDDLKEIYAEIQLNCSDFRENVFFKNIAIVKTGFFLRFLTSCGGCWFLIAICE